VPTISGTATENQTLTASAAGIADADGLGTFAYQWTRNGAEISGATSTTYVLADADVGALIRVRVSWTDGAGKPESVTSAATPAVAGVNDSPTGSVTISGAATQGQTLAAVTSNIADPDGLGAFAYQWRRGGTPISGATASTYTLVQADVGAAISVVVSWTDGQGFSESLTSDNTGAVANVNDAPTGALVITGTPTEGQTLTADSSAITDLDGLGPFTFSWRRDGTTISGATSSTYTLVTADVGFAITARVSYTDGGGASESVTSAPTAAVAAAPTGSVYESGIYESGVYA
jgi:hypothetical protein